MQAHEALKSLTDALEEIRRTADVWGDGCHPDCIYADYLHGVYQAANKALEQEVLGKVERRG